MYIAVLLNFSSAFNAVDFDILIKVLRSRNILSLSITWFNKYLRGLSQCVRLNDTFSDSLYLTAGVPRVNLVLSTLYEFIDVISSIVSFEFHLNSDDLQLYRRASIMDLIDVN